MKMIKMKNNIFIESGWFPFYVGLFVIILIMVFRSIAIENSLLSDLGSGYISLTAPEINGYSPTVFYRIMHNLTAIWSLISYFLLMTLGEFWVAHAAWQPQKIRLCHVFFAAVHVIFVALFFVSLFLPVGDMITILK